MAGSDSIATDSSDANDWLRSMISSFLIGGAAKTDRVCYERLWETIFGALGEMEDFFFSEDLVCEDILTWLSKIKKRSKEKQNPERGKLNVKQRGEERPGIDSKLNKKQIEIGVLLHSIPGVCRPYIFRGCWMSSKDSSTDSRFTGSTQVRIE